MIGDKNGWPCRCGNTVDPHLLTCPECKYTLTLDKALTGLVAEAPSPPIDEWIQEARTPRIYSPESMDDVLAQARKRRKNVGKRGRQRKSQPNSAANSRSSEPWLITILLTAIGFIATYVVSATRTMAPGWVSYTIIAITSIIYLITVNNPRLLNQYVNSSQLIRGNHDYYRLLSSGALHANLLHLLLNMYTFYSFGPVVESDLGRIFPASVSSTIYLSLYLSAIVASNIPSYLRHRNQRTPFSSLGASGAICAVIGATVLMNPRATVLFMGVLPMPAFVFFIGFLIISRMLSLKANASGNRTVVDHSAHITGALYGFLVMAALAYSAHIDPVANFLHPHT
jgi:membrane associated rhomboid family serine protease